MAGPRIRRVVKMFVDTQDCDCNKTRCCRTSQVIVHAAQLEDGTWQAVVSDPENPSRRVQHDHVNGDDLVKFLNTASVLGTQTPNVV